MLSADPNTVAKVEDEIIIRMDADLTEDGSFGQRTLEVLNHEVRVLDPSGAVLLSVKVSDLANAKTESLVSGGRLVLQTNNHEEIEAVSFTMSLSKTFSEIARGIEHLANGEEFVVNFSIPKLRCEKCNRLLPEKDGLCPSCLSRGRTLLRLTEFMSPYKRNLAILACTVGLMTLLNLVPPALQAYVIDGFKNNSISWQQLVQFILIWIGVLALAAGMQIMNGRMMTWLGSSIARDLRVITYRAIEFLQIEYFDKKPVGAIASRVTQDTDRVWFFLSEGMPYFIVNGLMLLAVGILLFVTNWVLALAILIPIPLVVLISVSLWKPISNLFFRASQKMARIHMHLNESLMGIRVVKAFAKEDHEYERFVARSNELRLANNRAEMTWQTAYGAMTFCVASGTVIHWLVGGWMVLNNQLTFGQFFMVHAYLGMIYGPLQWFAMVNNWFSRAMAGAERIFEIRDMTPEPSNMGGISNVVKGDVEFKAVRFGYEKSNPVIKDVSFDVKAGEMIGLVGHSGSGKSTTINLLSRFYEPDQGQILIDGVDYRDLDLRSYREQIGIVLQEPFLFHGTIAENISYGKPDATMEEIMEAAKAANAHSFVLAKPEGYDTIVGERGARLSGGEKQRISIARAILHNPRILILDEATSSVDVETELQIQEAIQHLVSGRTTFAIAHRLSTLRQANRLIVMDRGKIIEMGTHEELMDSKGHFYELVQTQSAVNSIIGVGAD